MLKRIALLMALIMATGCMPFSMAEQEREDVYDWEWYQTPAENQEGKAYLSFSTFASPVLLIENNTREITPYVWNISYVCEEVNGVDFYVDRITEVYFNEAHDISDVFVMSGEACVAFFDNCRLPAGSADGYNVFQPACADVGYGVAVSGTDANGNELTFGYYLPLSQEIQKTYTPDVLRQSVQPEEGKAHMQVVPVADPAPLLYDEHLFDGGYGWFYTFTMSNDSNVAFTVHELVQLLFNGDAMVHESVYGPDMLSQWEMPVFEGDVSYEFTAGMPALSAVTSVGYIVRGVDANGNGQEFTTLIELEQKE